MRPVPTAGGPFVIHMDREARNDYPLGKYDVTVKITTFEQDREIAWTIEGQIKPQIGHVYGYRLEPVEGGTLVTSYYDWSNIDEQWREAAIFPVIPESALRATLRSEEHTPELQSLMRTSYAVFCLQKKIAAPIRLLIHS